MCFIAIVLEIPETWTGDYEHGRHTLEDVPKHKPEYKSIEQQFVQEVGRKVSVTNVSVIC